MAEKTTVLLNGIQTRFQINLKVTDKDLVRLVIPSLAVTVLNTEYTVVGIGNAAQTVVIDWPNAVNYGSPSTTVPLEVSVATALSVTPGDNLLYPFDQVARISNAQLRHQFEHIFSIFLQIVGTANLLNTSLGNVEANEVTIANHEGRITTNEADIANHEGRITAEEASNDAQDLILNDHEDRIVITEDDLDILQAMVISAAGLPPITAQDLVLFSNPSLLPEWRDFAIEVATNLTVIANGAAAAAAQGTANAAQTLANTLNTTTALKTTGNQSASGAKNFTGDLQRAGSTVVNNAETATAATADSVVRRDPGGRVNVAAPTLDSHATILKQFTDGMFRHITSGSDPTGLPIDSIIIKNLRVGIVAGASSIPKDSIIVTALPSAGVGRLYFACGVTATSGTKPYRIHVIFNNTVSGLGRSPGAIRFSNTGGDDPTSFGWWAMYLKYDQDITGAA